MDVEELVDELRDRVADPPHRAKDDSPPRAGAGAEWEGQARAGADAEVARRRGIG